MQCRDISCFQSRYHSNGYCFINETLVERFCYAVFITLTPFITQKLPVIFLLDSEFINRLHLAFAHRVPFFEETVEQIGIFIEDGGVDRDEHVNSFVLYLLLKMRIYDETDMLLNVLQSLNYPEPLFFSIYDMHFTLFLNLSVYSFAGVTVGEVGQFTTKEDLTFDGLNKIQIQQADNLTCAHKGIVPFTQIKECPFITIGIDETDIEIQNGFLWISETKTNLSKWEYEIHAGNIYLCLEEYKRINGKLYTRVFKRKSESLAALDERDILALVCICLSLFSLIIVIVTYSYFTQLQSQPGINNLILCVFLFFAQSMYQFGAGQSSLPKWACSLVGALCHFMWLAAIFSMNVCSVHIYLTFSKSRKLSATYNCKQTFVYIAYIVIASLVFILTNVIVSLARSHGQEVGYGETFCYLSSSLMQVVTFLIPLAVLLIVNFLLFAVVVFKINRISTATSKVKKEKSYLLVYARLSSLTGITWIVGFLQLIFNHEIFEYLFIIFNASQGIFIMIAFVLNKRICSFFCRKKTYEARTNDTVNIDQSLRTTGTINFNQSVKRD